LTESAQNTIIIPNAHIVESNMEDLQNLLEKINREGVEKADARAKEIIDAANAKAAEILKAAKEEASRADADAKRAAEEYAERARASIAQAARDTVLKIEASVTEMLEKVLAKDIDRALADEANAAALALEAVKGLVGPAEIAAPPALANALRAQLASRPEISVTTDETLGTGFSVRTDGGRIEHSFKGETLVAELSRRLRPDLAKLLK